MESVFSNEGDIPMGASPGPAAPVINGVAIKGRAAVVNIALPATMVDGSPLATLTMLTLFYKPESFAGSTPEAERAAKTPMVETALDDTHIGQVMDIEIPGPLAYNQDYKVVATVND